MIERITNSGADDEKDQEFETTLRPHDFNSYVGQDRLKKNLQLAITAA